jgi:hypothetical protein
VKAAAVPIPTDARSEFAAGAPFGLPRTVADSFSTFRRAVEKLGETVADFHVADSRIRLRVAGSSLLNVFAALFHRRIAPSEATPRLTICAFEGSTSGLVPSIVAELDGMADPAAQVSIWRNPGLQLLRHRRPLSSLEVYDASTRVGLFYLEDVRKMGAADYCRPLHQFFRWWQADGPWQPIHAAAVAGPAGGVLLGGKSGSGKSRTALICARAGWRYAGDDLVLVRSRPEPWAENIYSSARLADDSLARLGEFRSAAFASGARTDEKTDLILDRLLSREQFAGFSVQAILLPKVRQGPETTFRPASRADTLLALAPSTMIVDGGDAGTFARISEAVNALPAYWLDVGGDIDGIPEAIENLLKIVPMPAALSAG